MIDFELSEEHQLLEQTVRDWGARAVAPRATAQAATLALIVSIDTGRPSSTTAGRTGPSRSNSCSKDTGTAPPYGRVDSAPTSRTSAPSACMRRAWTIAVSGSMNCPPSENESGVTFRIPMTIGRPSASRSLSSRDAALAATGPETA